MRKIVSHPDANLGGFPDPNDGWPSIDTTYIPRNTLKATADGSVCVIPTGRRTMTKANAFQKMPLPSSSLTGTWNNFVRIDKPDSTVPLYSSLVAGQWNTATGVAGDSVVLNGVWKTQSGVVVVGCATSGVNAMPTANVPIWGSASESGTQSAVLAYLSASNLYYERWYGGRRSRVFAVFCRKTNENDNILTWATASERNVAHFELERSLDGKTFELIGKVTAKNTPSVSI